VVTREALLADTFLKLADTLVDDFDAIDVLTTLSSRCVELLDAASTGILLADPGGVLHVMAASSEAANILELFQIQNEEGPCLDAFRTGEVVIVDDLTEDPRWPAFARRALDVGFISVHAFPMVVRSNLIGTMNLFMTTVGSLEPSDVVVAQALAHAATLTLLHNQATMDSQRLTAQLQGALNSRIVVEQAKGVISELSNIGTDAAFDRLRTYARSHNTKLTTLAEAVVNRTLDQAEHSELLQTLTQPAPNE
jgi:GAF domain-containing protein